MNTHATIARLEREVADLKRRLDGLPVRWPTGVPLEIRRFKVQSVGDNHLVCRHYEGGSHNILVAKALDLRKAFFDGRTIDGWLYTVNSATQMTLTKSGQATEVHTITPSYTVVDEIFAAHWPQPGTGVQVDDVVLRWMEIAPTRSWARSG